MGKAIDGGDGGSLQRIAWTRPFVTGLTHVRNNGASRDRRIHPSHPSTTTIGRQASDLGALRFQVNSLQDHEVQHRYHFPAASGLDRVGLSGHHSSVWCTQDDQVRSKQQLDFDVSFFSGGGNGLAETLDCYMEFDC
jgi:hypothetical protein